MLNSKEKFLLFLLITVLISCSSSTEPDYADIVYNSGIPVITGFYVTTTEQPDGTGEIIGNPAYEVDEINIFPNPYEDKFSRELNRYNRFVTFTHLPRGGNVTIIIVKGISREAANFQNSSYFGTSKIAGVVPIVNRIVKQDSSHFARWEVNNATQSGYYRAYIFGDAVPDNYFIDFYLTIKQIGLLPF